MDKECLLAVYVIHILVWVFVIFGGIVSPNMCKFNLFILVPVIYIIHTFPFHVLLKKKLEMINQNIESFEQVNREVDPVIADQLMKSGPPNISQERKLKIAQIYFAEEDKLLIPKLFRQLCGVFSESFANPFSPQGLLILGMITNVYLLKFYWKEIN